MRTGKVTENVLKRSVLKQITKQGKTIEGFTKSAAVGTDCAFCNCNSSLQTSTLDMDEQICLLAANSSISMDVKNAAGIAVAGACNNLLCSGGRVDMLELSVLLPEDAEESKLKEIIEDATNMSSTFGTYIGGGHTEVSSSVVKPVITVTAIGRDCSNRLFLQGKAKAGDSLIVTKSVAFETAVILAMMKEEEITARYPAHMAAAAAGLGRGEMLSIASEAAVAAKSGATAMHDLSSGGIFAALWEMAEHAGTGLRVDLKKIPIKQETVEITDLFGINPYQSLSTGALLVATPDGENLCQQLLQAGIEATIIGQLSSGNDRIIINENETRYLDMPAADEIHKIFC